MIILENINIYWVMIINGICTGLGVSLGTYIANKHIIKNLKRIKNKIKK